MLDLVLEVPVVAGWVPVEDLLEFPVLCPVWDEFLVVSAGVLPARLVAPVADPASRT